MNKLILLSLLILGVANLIWIRSYSTQTNNVLEAAAELKANGIKYDICNINGVPCLVYTVGNQPFYYDGLIASYALDFIPTTSVAKNYTLPTSLYFPPNSCLVKALVEYKQHSSAPIDVIVFIPNHAQNIYAYSLPEFEEELSEFGHIRINAVFVKGQFIINTK